MRHFSFACSASVGIIIIISYSSFLFAAVENPKEIKHTIAFKVNGFMSVVGGKILGSEDHDTFSTNSNYQTPLYIADWGNAGLYGTTFSLNPESRVGLQTDAVFNEKLSFTGQFIVRGSSMGPNVSWLYGTYNLNDEWKLQVGRKRIPLYYYSDFQDVGLIYPWISVPPELYGWQATNYNGASLRYTSTWGDTNVTSSIFSGRESIGHSLYSLIFNSEPTRVVWNNLLGVDFEANKGSFTTRLVYTQANTSNHDLTADSYERAHQKSYGIAMNYDADKWFILSEATQLSNDLYESGYTYYAPAATIGYGRRIGAWTPFVNYAIYWERTATTPDIYDPNRWMRFSASLRYDIDPSKALKAQIDRNRDYTSSGTFTGYHTIFRFGYDMVF
jgi:hypothetical protein